MQIEVLLNGSGECLYSEGRRIWPKYSVVFSDTSMTQIGRIRILRLRKQNMRYQCGRISSSIPPTQAAWHKSCMRRQAHDSSSTLVFRWICVARLLAVFHQRWMNANGHTVLGQGCLGPITIARADTQQYAFLMSDSPWIASRVISFFFSRWRVFLSFTSSCLRFLSLSLSLCLLLNSPELSLRSLPSNWRVRMPLPLPWRLQGPQSPLRDSSLSRLSPFLTGRHLPRIIRSPAGGDIRSFDLWIPWHRHRDDQSSNYGRNPHVSAHLQRSASRP